MKNPHLTERITFRWTSTSDVLIGLGIDLWPKWEVGRAERVYSQPITHGVDV